MITRASAKVVHLHKFDGISGSETHLRHLLPRLDRTRFDPVLLMLTAGRGADAGYVRAFEEEGIRVETLPIRADVDPLLIRRLTAWLRIERPAILHTHLIHGDLYGALCGAVAGLPVLISTKHNDDAFRLRRLFVMLERRLVRRACRVITISESLRQFVLQSTGLAPNQVVTVRYGYEPPPHPTGCRSETLERFGVPVDAKLVVAIGRLVPQKGHADLLRAFASVLREEPGAWLLIAGEGGLRRSLEALAIDLGIHQRMTLPGHCSDVPSLLAACSVYAHPSLWEGFGLVLLEAMAARRPIVAARVSAIPEIVDDGVTGLLVPPRNPPALAEAIVRLLRDPAAAVELGEAGYGRLREHFTVAAMAAATEHVYAQCLAAIGPRI